MFSVFVAITIMFYCYRAYKEVNRYYTYRQVMIEDHGEDGPRLSMLGMFMVGIMWPYWSYVWWQLEKENEDG